MKKCSKCGETKPYAEFYLDRKSAGDGYQYQCKICKRTSVLAAPSARNSEYKRSYEKTEQRRKYKREYYHKNKVSMNISRRMRQSIGGKKCATWTALVGYSLAELKLHLESKFTPEMTWDNYGTYWQIDHIVPVSSFNILGPTCAEFKKCWNLDNLQPLSSLDNRLKSNKL